MVLSCWYFKDSPWINKFTHVDSIPTFRTIINHSIFRIHNLNLNLADSPFDFCSFLMQWPNHLLILKIYQSKWTAHPMLFSKEWILTSIFNPRIKASPHLLCGQIKWKFWPQGRAIAHFSQLDALISKM